MSQRHRPVLTDLHDGVYPGDCSECQDPIDSHDWFWFVDGGSVFLTFCQDCGAPDGEWDYVTQATAVRLVDDRTGEPFDRAIDLGPFFNA